MSPLSLIESLTMVELLIMGFIAANTLLSGAFVVQRGVEKYAAARGK